MASDRCKLRARNHDFTLHGQSSQSSMLGVHAQVIHLETSAAGGVSWEQVDDAQLTSGNGSNGSNGSGAPKKALKVKVPKWCGRWVVGMNDYADGVVGAKSKNIAGTRSLAA